MKSCPLIAALLLICLAILSCGKTEGKKEEESKEQAPAEQSLFLSQADSVRWINYLHYAPQDTALAYLLLGSFYLSSGLPDSALDYLNTAARYDPDRSVIYLNIGDAYNQIAKKAPAAERDSIFKLAADAFHNFILKSPGSILSQDIFRIVEKYHSLESEKEIK